MPLYLPSSFRHTQSSPAAVWTIVHNLGGNGSQGTPIIDVLIDDSGTLTKTLPLRVEKIDANTVEVEFSTPQFGVAVIVV